MLAMMGALVVVAVSTLGGESNAKSAPIAQDTVVAVGDIACPVGDPVTRDSCAQSAVANRISRINPAAVLLLGDIQYHSGALEDFRTSFGKSWGALRKQWRPTVGNHEYFTADAAGYFKFFDKQSGNVRGNYSFDVAAWHFIALNSNCAVVSCAAGSPQGKWLKRDLAKSSGSKCVAAFWHAPMYSSGGEHGNYAGVKPLWMQLQKAHAELVLSGHDHDYERFAPQDQNGKADPQGIRQFVSGAGGRSHYEFGKRKPNSQVRIADRFGALSLQLSKHAYRWRFVSTSGAILDRGTARCH